MSWKELNSWSTEMGQQLEGWEIKALWVLDGAWMGYLHEMRDNPVEHPESLPKFTRAARRSIAKGKQAQ